MDKVEAILKIAEPCTAKEVNRFVGGNNFYHRMCHSRPHILAPLNSLTKNGAKFEWIPKCAKSLN